MKFKISKVNTGYWLTPIDEYDPDLTIICDHFHKSLTAGDDCLEFKNWALPFKYCDDNLPIKLKYLIGTYEYIDNTHFFKLNDFGPHKLLVYDWARDPEKPSPEEIKSKLNDSIHCYHSSFSKGYGSLYEVVKK